MARPRQRPHWQGSNTASPGRARAKSAKKTIGAGDLALLVRLWRTMRPYRAMFVASLLLLPLISGLSLLQPHLIQLAVDDHITPQRLEGLWVIVAIFAGAVVGGFALQFAQFLLMQLVGQRAVRDLRQAVFEHVVRLRLAYFHRTPTGQLMTRVTSDIENLQEAFSSGMVSMLGDGIALLAIVVILLVKDWRLALVTFTIVPLVIGITVTFRALMRGAFRRVRSAIAHSNAYFQEAVTGMAVVQLTNQEEAVERAYRRRSRALRDASFDAIRWDASFYALVEAIGSITVGLIIWYGSAGALEGVISLGLLISFVEYVEKFFRPIRDLTQKYALLQNAMASSEKIFALLDTDEVIPEASAPIPLPALRHGITFRNVWFAYQNEDWVLRDVSFHVPCGARIALVGHTGAGKSTITKLLTRMHDVQRGAILVDGVDIRSFALHELRRLFAVVLQDVFLFHGSVMDNITMHSPEVSEAQARAAAELVQADRFILARQPGYQHVLTERGANLSAGERQLLAFARALAHAPEVLILDEATSSVDNQTEALIQRATLALLAQQTSVVVAHRLSTIRHCDAILVLHQGSLREQGTHDELVALDGLYAALYALDQISAVTETPRV